MTLKKRGLGRGLEALLVDVSAKEQTLPLDAVNSDNAPTVINKVADSEAMALALIETLQQENLNLLQEAVALRELADEFEAMVRHL